MKKAKVGMIFLVLIIAGFSLAFHLYKAEPDFWLERFYESVYAERLEAKTDVRLNEAPVIFDLTEGTWHVQKNNGQWFTPPKKAGAPMVSGYQSKTSAIVTSPEDKLTVESDKKPDRASLKIKETNSGGIVWEEQPVLAQLPLPERNGLYTYELKIEWTGEANPYRGEYVLEIPVAVDLPPEFVFSGESLRQGQMLEVTVYNAGMAEDIIFEQAIYDKFQWYQQDGFFRGYLPTNHNVKPGVYQIKYGSKSKGTAFTREIEIKAYAYETQYLSIARQTVQATRNDAAYTEFNTYFVPVRNQSEPSRYFSESFVVPVRGRLSTEFGETRYVNGSLDSRHSGMDIAADAETEVKAANRGKVVLARFLTVTGNTVVIDHGEGLFSVYYHMLNFSVAAGEIAERGQKIGEVGSTGFSTGPHLHFTMSYYTMNLDPGYFLAGQPITYDNYREFIE